MSVITVCYNAASSIEATLESIAEQSWTNLEHIIVDGGSTDETLDIIRRFGGASTLVSERDEGIYDAMNKGVSCATGDIVGFLHADDRYAYPDVIRDVATAIELHGADAVFGDAAFFTGQAPNNIVRRYRSSNFTPRKLGWGWMPAHTTLFVRRHLFDRVGEYSKDYRIAGDFEWIARAFSKTPIQFHYLPRVLVYMRTGGISTAGWRSTLLLNREVMRACRANGIRTNWFKLLSKYPGKALEFIAPRASD